MSHLSITTSSHPEVVEGESGELSLGNGEACFRGNDGPTETETISRPHMNGHSKTNSRPFTITVSDISDDLGSHHSSNGKNSGQESHSKNNGAPSPFHQVLNGNGNANGLLLPNERSASPYGVPSRDRSESPRPSVSPGASSNNSFPSYDWESLDPESNLYIANFPNDFGEENLRHLFSRYGPIARAKFVPVPNQRAYGFVQFVNVEDSHRALKEMDGYRLDSGEQLFMSVALRKRSSLSEEPTNLYVKNIPESWTYHELNVLFGPHGRIVQSRVAGDRIAFVRYETHYQAIKAIDNLNGVQIDGAPAPLEVKFANRKRAVKEYNNPAPVHKSNANNLYVRGLPPSFAQIQLEELFAPCGTVSSTRMFPNGVAFVRFAERDSAIRAIQHLHNQIIPGCTTPLTVKLAYFDIGDSRNRTWKHDRSSDNEPRERPSRSHHQQQHRGRPDHRQHHQHHHQHQQQQHERMPTGAFNKNVFQGGPNNLHPRPRSELNAPNPQLAHDYYSPYNTHQPHMQYTNGDVASYAVATPMTAASYPYGGLAIIPPVPVSSSPGLSVPGAGIVAPPSPGAVPGVAHSPNLHSPNLHSPISPQQSNGVHVLPISPARAHVAQAPTSAPVGMSVFPPVGASYAMDAATGMMQPFAVSMQPTMVASADGQAIYAAAQPIISPIAPSIFLTPQSIVPTGSSPQGAISVPMPSPGSQSAPGMSGSVTPSRPTMPTANLGTTVVQQQKKQFSQQQRRQGDIIYQLISEKYPRYASKVTGMILNLGETEAERLLSHRDELDKKVDEAVRILQAVEQQNPINLVPISANGGVAGDPTQAGES